jgi:hypothetical protein
MGVQLGFMGVQLGGKGHLGRFTGLRLRCGDWRAAAGGCHCASLMMKRRAAAAAVRPCVRPGPGSPPSSFPQVTCLDRPGGPVLPPLFGCGMRAWRALAVLAWSGDGSPVWGCTTTSGDQVPPRTHKNPISAQFCNQQHPSVTPENQLARRAPSRRETQRPLLEQSYGLQLRDASGHHGSTQSRKTHDGRLAHRRTVAYQVEDEREAGGVLRP